MGTAGLGDASPEQECIMVREIVGRRLRSLYVDIPALRSGTVGAYALACVSAGVATVLRMAVDPYVEGAQFITFFPAIVITTLISGFGAGILSVVLSTAAIDYFLLPTPLSLYVEDPAHVVDLLLFAPLASICVALIAEIRRSLVEREQAERALRAIKDRLQLALNAARLGSWQYDPRRRVALWDTRFQEIVDIARDEAPLEELLKRVHPDDRRRFLEVRRTALDPADPKPYTIEYRISRNDGKIRWVESHGLAYFEGAGLKRQLVSFVGTAQDITERKEREEREHLLMREVSHRAKNMLSVVNTIAHQTAAKTPEDFIERFSERIQALSANQDLLIKSEWHGVEIEDLVRAQLVPFTDFIGSRIAVRGPKLRLNAASAQAVGLALHELTTNAGKYGALSKDTGGLEIGWGTEAETFTISWTERDGPVSPSPRRGFGTLVMKEMTERSLNGKVELEYAPSGVTWRLTCQAGNALDANTRRGPQAFEGHTAAIT
jgi:PAS domain S-box-containing protein